MLREVTEISFPIQEATEIQKTSHHILDVFFSSKKAWDSSPYCHVAFKVTSLLVNGHYYGWCECSIIQAFSCLLSPPLTCFRLHVCFKFNYQLFFLVQLCSLGVSDQLGLVFLPLVWLCQDLFRNNNLVSIILR